MIGNIHVIMHGDMRADDEYVPCMYVCVHVCMYASMHMHTCV
jgi:hypothetical protein